MADDSMNSINTTPPSQSVLGAFFRLLGWLLGLFILLIMLVQCVGSIGQPRKAQSARDDFDLIWQTEERIRSAAREPDSLEFRDTRVVTRAQREPVVCGKVNGKNGFGGYTGYLRFIAIDGTHGTLRMEPVLEEDPYFEIDWSIYCAPAL